MKKGKFLLFVGFSVLSSVVFGQDYAFKVLANKGANEVKSGDSWAAVKTGASLKKEDELKIPENAYLGLVSATGKPIELKQAGTYKVADLASKVGTGTSVLNKYTDFILSSNSAEAKKNRLSATGAVHRGITGPITVYLPKTSNIYNKDLVIKWESTVAGPYVVKLKNMFEDELMKVETPENTTTFDMSDPKFANESAILVEVKPKSEASSKDSNDDKYSIKKLSAADHDKIKKALSDIMPEVNEGNAMDFLVLAGFYEQHNLTIDALAAYDKAMKLAPDVPSFREAYDSFLIRNELKPVEKAK
jgi:hypothetical protein